MGDPAGQGADRLHFMGLAQLGGQLLPLSLPCLVLGDIGHDAFDRDRLIRLIRDQYVALVEPADFASTVLNLILVEGGFQSGCSISPISPGCA